MTQYVNDMVAEGISPAKIPVDCQTQPGQGTCISWSIRKSAGGFPERSRGEIVQVDAGILGNIGIIIQVPGRIEGIAVGKKNYNQKKRKN
jgi:hypothetical protein